MNVDLLHPDSNSYPRTGIEDLPDTGWILIGVVQMGEEYFPLAVKEAGRNRLAGYFRDGEIVELELTEVGPAIYDAIDEACAKLWGHSWNAALGELFGLNRRTLQRDRVSRYLLPAKILATISYIASADDGEELAKALLAISAYHAKFENPEIVTDYIRNAIEIFYELNPKSRTGNDD